ncbi:MAG: GNAT family N-acetyltransferase [Bacteroidales bacterium]|nr:GNAT family N-acetyltransferase [Bacteroidales bacterium]
MEILQAKPRDLVEAIYLLEKCIQDYMNRRKRHWISLLPERQDIVDDIENGNLFLAKHMGITKGLIAIKENEPEGYSGIEWKEGGEKVMFVHYIAVHPRWANGEVSKEMLQYLEKYAAQNDYTSIRLDALYENEPLADAIEASGFSNAGEFQTEYQQSPHKAYEKNIG